MTSILQISDPHFGTEQPPVVNALVKLAHEHTPHLVVLSGDITQRARRGQFRAARAFVDRLAVPATLVIPGNHDIPLYNVLGRLFAPYAGFRREFGDELEPVFESDRLLVLGLNTTRFYRHVQGEISAAQVERVSRRLAAADERQLRVVVTHQPIAVRRIEEEHNLLHGRFEAVRRWTLAGADLILGGHIHLPFVLALHEQIDNLPRRVWAIQAGTATSTRVRHEAGNSVNLIRYVEPPGGTAEKPRRRATVERWDYQALQERFLPARSTELVFGEVGAAEEAHGAG